MRIGLLPSATEVASTRVDDLAASPITRRVEDATGRPAGVNWSAIPKARSSPRSPPRAVTQVFAEMPFGAGSWPSPIVVRCCRSGLAPNGTSATLCSGQQPIVMGRSPVRSMPDHEWL